jgi:hypothetical protein
MWIIGSMIWMSLFGWGFMLSEARRRAEGGDVEVWFEGGDEGAALAACCLRL